MKKNILLLLLPFIFLSRLFAQSVAINTDGSVANTSAILDIKSTTKGFADPTNDYHPAHCYCNTCKRTSRFSGGLLAITMVNALGSLMTGGKWKLAKRNIRSAQRC